MFFKKKFVLLSSVILFVYCFINVTCFEMTFTQDSNNEELDESITKCLSIQFDLNIKILAVNSNNFNGDNIESDIRSFMDGTVISVACAYGHRDRKNPCKTQLLRCSKGMWRGEIPSCVKVDGCYLSNGQIVNGDFGSVSSIDMEGNQFSVGEQIAYTCSSGYRTIGKHLITCQAGGCWDPVIPMCEPQFYLNTKWSEYLNANTTILIVILTVSVLFMMFTVCISVICRHRPKISVNHRRLRNGEAAGIAPVPPSTAPSISSVPAIPTTLLDPDRVALITFDDMQSGLPTYEEAMRCTSNNHHPPSTTSYHNPLSWFCRTARLDMTCGSLHFARQRQLSSTPGECMGSTDTMTVSDVSTNVTLDTASSHTCGSGTSQTASCIAVCGSLASFDTNSVLNSEGLPLLEENESEEDGAHSNSDNIACIPSSCDNISFKMHSDID